VESGLVPIETLINALCINPRKIFGLPGGSLEVDEIADVTVIGLNRPYVIHSEDFCSLGRATPFEGWGVSANIAMTVCGGEVVYHNLHQREVYV
jgi:dihydroorotase